MSADELSTFGVLCTYMGSIATAIGMMTGAVLAKVRNSTKGPCKRCSSPAPEQTGS
ncbi:hypothetical protein OHU11_30040 [Streptomyces sp. NBC_00257]|uniref:hypothetical protein n=1 Tax=unclassified Streptomyces TaxID=2593676 RepID=UPI002252B80E|nr:MULTISPECIES: hypothetical protein [unclassified Streptomyces]MCX5431893.1 hypothetical protein [Streptomyces sp. NBC_00062]